VEQARFVSGYAFRRATKRRIFGRLQALVLNVVTSHVAELSMSGYSGTPLAKKLGIKQNFRAALLHVPDDVRAELHDALAKCQIQSFSAEASRDLEFIFFFAKSRATLELELMAAAKSLSPAGMLWISWPKKSSGVATDLTENLVRQRGLDAGLVDIKICAVTEVWSGLKFVIPVKNRPEK
jgi:hypothetical protein